MKDILIVSGGKPKCRIITADWKEIDAKVVKNLRTALKPFGVKLISIDTKSDFYALAICDSKATLKDVNTAYDKWRSK
jgi:hypothetical protein